MFSWYNAIIDIQTNAHIRPLESTNDMPKETVAQTLLRARSHHKKGETAQARALYQSILKVFPNNKRARQAIAALDPGTTKTPAKASEPAKSQIGALFALYNQGRFVDVVEQASQLAKAYPSSRVIWSFLGAASAQSGQNRRAVVAYNQATKLNPQDAGSHYSMGVALQSLGQVDDAISAYKKAIANQPHHADAYNNLGNAYTFKNDLDAALTAYKRAIAIKPDNAGTHNNIGTTLRTLGRLGPAIAAYEMALKIDPQFADALLNMGNAFKEQNKHDEAIAAYQRGVQIRPNNAEAFNNLGTAFDEKEKPDNAIAAFQRAITIQPDYADARINLSEVLRKEGHLDWALSACREGLIAAPESPGLHCSLGRLLIEKIELEGAAEAFKRALIIDPGNVDAAKCIVSLPTGLVDLQTLSRVKSIFDQSGDTVDMQFSKADYLRQTGKMDAAFKALCLANKAKAETIQDHAQEEEINRQNFLAELSKWAPRTVKSGRNSLKKIFILGPSRSGKSSFEKTLARSKRVYPFFELGTKDFRQAKEEYISQKQSPNPSAGPEVGFSNIFKKTEESLIAQGLEVITCTNPHMLNSIPFIADTVPNSYFIFIHRNQYDVAAEIFATLYRTANLYSYDPNTIMAYLEWYEGAAKIIKSKLPNQVMTASFEQIMRQPDELIQNVRAFITTELGIASQTQTIREASLQSVFREQFQKQAQSAFPSDDSWAVD